MIDDRQTIRTAAAGLVLVGVLVAAAAIAAAVGRVAIPLGDQARIVVNALRGEPFGGDPRLGSILLDVRLPRVALAGITGAGLALSGAALQGLFRNPLADPYLVGVSSGASVGAVLALEAGLPVGFYAAGAVQGAAFSGGLLAVAVTLALARAGGETSIASMLLAGVAVAAVGGALTSFVLFSSGERIFAAYAWLLGGFNTADWTLVRLVAIPTLIGGGFLFLLGPALDLLQLDEEGAQAMGLRVELTKLATIVAATLVAAAAVSASGLIAFVGLIAPHVVRLVVGPNHRRLVGLAALGGAAFLVLADLLARTALPDGDLPVGVVTAAIGGPFFLALLRLRRDRVG